VKERCSCGAKFEYVRGEMLNGERLERVWEMVKDWRDNHHHEMTAESEGPGMIHESGSSHERAETAYVEGDRMQIGFRLND
jgi:hypothetical protein